MEKTKFINLIDSLGATATKNKWEPSYDKKLDQFYWHQPHLSEDASLVKVSHETSIYVSKKSGVEGIFVEYLKSNFVQHNPLFESLTASFRKKIAGSLFTVSATSKEERDRTRSQLLGLAEALKADIYKDALEEEYSTNDLVKLVTFATAKHTT